MTKAEHHNRLKARLEILRDTAELVLSDVRDGNYRIDERLDEMAIQVSTIRMELSKFREES